MAPKRKAKEAFGSSNGQLSAFAAARLAKQARHIPSSKVHPVELDEPLNASALAQVLYDGHHEDVVPDGESDIVDIIAAPTSKPASTVQLSTLRHEKDAVTEEFNGSLKVTLRNDETVTCIGEYELRVLDGIATIYGAVFYPSSSVQHVYAPSTHALPCISARRDGTVIQLSHVRSTIRNLEKLSPLFRNIWTKVEYQQRTFSLLYSTPDDELLRSLIPLEIDKATAAVLSRLAAEAESTASLTRIMAIGAKSSGKSTFNRALCNALNSKPPGRKILFLDLDPGQPEFGPPGQVSLVELTAPILGPPLTHAASVRSAHNKLLRSHTIAATSFKDDPEHYIACAIELVQHADRQYPLVVNSCGWIGGLGASVLQDLALSLNITQVVLMEPLDTAFVETLQGSCSDASFHRLGRQPVRPAPRTPAESRNMQTMAYFHYRASIAGREMKWTRKSVSTHRPWIVGYDSPHARIRTVISYGTNPHPDFLAEVLEGSLVALVRVDEHHEYKAYNVESYGRSSLQSSHSGTESAADRASISGIVKRTKDGLPYMPSSSAGASMPLDPRYSDCMGLALVRAVDTESKTLHLVTPLPESQIATMMDQQIAIVRGGFDAPDWAYLEALYGDACDDARSGTGGPWISRTEPVGIEGAVWRLRHPPMAADVR